MLPGRGIVQILPHSDGPCDDCHANAQTEQQEKRQLGTAGIAAPAGSVQPAEGQFMVIDFNGTLKKFSYTASMNSGYLSAEDPAVEARLQAYQDYNKEKDRLEKELKNLKAELMKL